LKKLLLSLLVLPLFCAPAWGQKAWKKKEKRFEPVVKEDARGYAGRYVSFADSYWVEVRADGAGRLTATLFEEGREVALRDLRLDGARLAATKVYDDGRTVPFAGLFANRVLNGHTAFGIMVDSPVKVAENLTVERAFYLLR
jgi:hypothetical protein